MVSEAIDFTYLLLENYKKMRISEQELATILMIDHLTSQGNQFVNADLLSLKMSSSVSDIDKILVKLLTRGFIEYVTKKNKTCTSLEPLKTKLYRQFAVSLSSEETSFKTKTAEEKLDNIYETFEQLLGRPLSPVELSKIREWISMGYSDSKIVDALKECLSKGKRSLRSVDKILLEWSTRDDIEKEGVSAISDDWDKNIEETIRIAKTPWLDDDKE